jgi:ankyrin repeat protein
MDIDNHQRTVLHMAVEGDFPTILSILLENAADPDAMDEDGNNRECT